MSAKDARPDAGCPGYSPLKRCDLECGKYVALRVADGVVLAVVAPAIVPHVQMVGQGAEPVGAGFFCVRDGLVRVCGKSAGLGISSRASDARAVQDTLLLMKLVPVAEAAKDPHRRE